MKTLSERNFAAYMNLLFKNKGVGNTLLKKVGLPMVRLKISFPHTNQEVLKELFLSGSDEKIKKGSTIISLTENFPKNWVKTTKNLFVNYTPFESTQYNLKKKEISLFEDLLGYLYENMFEIPMENMFHNKDFEEESVIHQSIHPEQQYHYRIPWDKNNGLYINLKGQQMTCALSP